MTYAQSERLYGLADTAFVAWLRTISSRHPGGNSTAWKRYRARTHRYFLALRRLRKHHTN
jgi:hypothetical protein